MFSKIHTVPQKMCAIDRDNFQSVEEKKKKTAKEKKKRQQHIPQPDITTTNYYYILPELEPIPLHIHFLTIP
jgi:t-SNARE complex subunit (syntaxin)